MKKDIPEKNKKINNFGYCSKCLKFINTYNAITDIDGNLFCSTECKNEYWYEIRRESDALFREWEKYGQ